MLFDKLVQRDVVTLEGKVRVFQSDYAFVSPSGSVAIILGDLPMDRPNGSSKA